MMDIGKTLLILVLERYGELIETTKRIAEIEKIADDLLDYKLVHEYAQMLGEILATSYQQIKVSDLPGGKMLEEIARKILQPTMELNFGAIADQAVRAQTALNKQSGIGLKAIRPKLNQDRIDGIIGRLAEAENFEDVKWLLGEPVVNFSQSIVDRAVANNSEFQTRAGLRPRIVRTATSDCCKWCSDLAGTYDYPGVPKDVYRRHQNCRCLVEYHPSKRIKQNVWTKKYTWK